MTADGQQSAGQFRSGSSPNHISKLTHSSGALLHNLPTRRVRRTSPSVSYRSETRLASKHYGIACSPIFDPVKHKGAKKYWDSFEGQWRCEVVNWVVNKVRP